MSQKLMYVVLVLAFCLSSSVDAATIVWVSDNKTPTDGVPADQAWVDLLEAQGYTVNLDFRNQEGRSLNAAEIEVLNSADLIIIGRDTNSGDYTGAMAEWNAITRPIIMQAAHIARNSRWLWIDTGSTNDSLPTAMEAVDTGHPMFNGVSLDSNNEVPVINEASSFASITDAGNGKLLAKRADNDELWIVEWEAGQEFYAGSGQIAGGRRMLFVSGTDSGVDGRYNLTAEGEIIFLNAIRYMLGVLKRVKAYNPDPEDAAVYEDTWVTLGWTPGDTAVSHDLYFGDNFEDVNDGAAEAFQGNQTTTFFITGFPGFPYPDGLVPGTTYYWRVDEVNELDPNSPWKGDVWSFMIPSKKAYAPSPADSARYINQDVVLSWTGGFGAKLHTVYLGDNFDDVNDGIVGLPQAGTTYTPATLELDKNYYWRIDEFDGLATHKGDVWSFRTIPDIQITDPNLIGWWMLDEGNGTTALDWSGHGNNGEIQGDPQWAAGYDGGSLDLDGDGDNIYVDSVQLPTNAFTITLWFNPSSVLNDGSTRQDFLYWQTGSRPHVTFNRSGNGEVGFWPNIDGDFDGPQTVTRSWAAGAWYHIAGTFDGSAFRIYVNGRMENVIGHPGTHSDASGLLIGCRTDQRNYFDGNIDDVRLYDKALSQDEIKLAMRGDTKLAWGPEPGNGSTVYIRDAMPLSWSAGDNASEHDVYFGTDKDAVADADASDTTGIYRGRQGVTSYTPAEGVEWGGGPYYWRIDEYNTDASISKGRVWSFTVADFLGVEDFEDYNDYEPDRIFDTWIDGWGVPTNGSTIGYPDPDFLAGEHFVETSIVHSGGQSMPYLFDNNLMYSEATMTLVYPRDWTQEGVGVLSLWFYGDADNAAERMYVALNGNAIVYHTNPNAAQTGGWTEWPIDLQEFAAQGVNLANVNTISIGFGDKNSLQAGGSGLVFFDDIRLYRSPEPAK